MALTVYYRRSKYFSFRSSKQVFLVKLVEDSERETTLVEASVVKFVSRIPKLEGRVMTTAFTSARRQQGSNRVVSRDSELDGGDYNRPYDSRVLSAAEQSVLAVTASRKQYLGPRELCQQGCSVASPFICRYQVLQKVLELRSKGGSNVHYL